MKTNTERKQKSLFANSIYKAILTIVNIVIPIFVGPYIVRILDVDLYGLYNKAYSLMQVFLMFASFGVYTYGIREISKVRDDKEKTSKLFTSLFLISLISNVITITLYVIFSLLTSKGFNLTLYIYLLVGIQIFANIFYIEFVNEAVENFKFITIKTAFFKVLYFIAIFSFVKKPNNILIYSLIIGLTVLFNNLASYIYIRKQISFNFKKVEIIKYLKPLFYVLILTNISILYGQLDKIMLGEYISPVAVTIYFIPYNLVLLVASIPTAMISVSIPRLSYIVKNKTKKEYENVINSIIKPYFFLVIPICLGMFVLAREIILIYGSEKYSASIIPFAFMSFTKIFLLIGNLLIHLVIYPNNKEDVYIKIAFIGGILNVIFNYMLLYFGVFNPTTAYLTTFIAEMFLITVEYFYIRKIMEIDLNIFNKKVILYFVLSFLFIPISLLIKLIGLGFYMNIMLIMITCFLFYVSVLYIIRDDTMFYIIGKIFKRGGKNE